MRQLADLVAQLQAEVRDLSKGDEDAEGADSKVQRGAFKSGTACGRTRDSSVREARFCARRSLL